MDLTNNNNESHNNYINNAIKEAHPSPAVLTVALVKELTLTETKLSKVKSGSKRIIKKQYRNLNESRTNIKKLYRKLDRIEYLSRIGNIVMHIQLNQGQMTELRDAKENDNDAGLENEHSEDDSEVEGDDDDDHTDDVLDVSDFYYG